MISFMRAEIVAAFTGDNAEMMDEGTKGREVFDRKESDGWQNMGGKTVSFFSRDFVSRTVRALRGDTSWFD